MSAAYINYNSSFLNTTVLLEGRFPTKMCSFLDLKNSLGEGRRRFGAPYSKVFVVLMHSSVDQELSAKIESELQMEKDIRDSEQYPARVQEYLDSSPFEVLHSMNQQQEIA